MTYFLFQLIDLFVVVDVGCSHVCQRVQVSNVLLLMKATRKPCSIDHRYHNFITSLHPQTSISFICHILPSSLSFVICDIQINTYRCMRQANVCLLVYTTYTNTSLIEAVKYFVYLAEMKLRPSLVCCYYHNNSSTKSRYRVDFLRAGIQATGCPPHPRMWMALVPWASSTEQLWPKFMVRMVKLFCQRNLLSTDVFHQIKFAVKSIAVWFGFNKSRYLFQLRNFLMLYFWIENIFVIFQL